MTDCFSVRDRFAACVRFAYMSLQTGELFAVDCCFVRLRADTVLSRFLRWTCAAGGRTYRAGCRCVSRNTRRWRRNGARGIAFTPRIVRRDAAYRYAEDKQMIRGRIKCARGVFSGVYIAGVNAGKREERKRIRKLGWGSRLAFRRAALIDT